MIDTVMIFLPFLSPCSSVVCITDDTWRREVTSYPAGGSDFLDLQYHPISEEMEEKHHQAAHTIFLRPASWTSHTVVVVDQSGSMRKDDVAGGVSRSDAVWVTLASTFIKAQLESGESAATDVMSVILMGEEAELVVDRKPMDWLLYNLIVRQRRLSEPAKARPRYCEEFS